MSETKPGQDVVQLIAHARKQSDGVKVPSRPPENAIAGYTLVREIHRGGQGVVYLAHQQATHRDVAIKLLREGPFVGQGERTRFEREIQILASLKHPNIVAIHDSGEASEHVYFVMDYIEGQPLDDWADDLRYGDPSASPRGREDRRSRHERLLLPFIKICDALNTAHQRGVIHRDLKPNNIRISDSDEPFVLDFGLAKWTSLDASTVKRTALTATGQFLGTLPWASPEQVIGANDHADIRTDVYAVGLMLFRALTGRMPYEPGHTIPEMMRIIIERTPARPGSIAREVDSDLETIVLKCLNKDPDRRYQTAGELAEDLQRYLRYEPIRARAEGSWYHLRMFVRRHRLATAAVAAFVFMLAAASVSLTYLYYRAKAGEALAQQRQAETRQVAEFQAARLANIDPEMMGIKLRESLLQRYQDAGGEAQRNVSPLEEALVGINFTDLAVESLDENVLSESLRAIDEQFESQPLLQAELKQTVANTLVKLGLHERALVPQAAALSMRQRILGTDNAITLASQRAMGQLLAYRGRQDEALAMLEENLQRRREVLGVEHADTLETMNLLANLFQAMSNFDQALESSRESLEAHRRILGNGDLKTIDAVNTMGTAFFHQGAYHDSIELFREALAGFEQQLTSDSNEALGAMVNLGHALMRLDRHEEALVYFERVVKTRQRVKGEQHPSYLSALESKAEVLTTMGRWEESLELRQRVFDGCRATHGEEHSITLRSMNGLGAVLLKLGRLDEAEPIVSASLVLHREKMGSASHETIKAINQMAHLLMLRGKSHEAIPLSKELLETTRRLNPGHPHLITLGNNLSVLLINVGRPEEALPYAEEALRESRAVFGEVHRKTLISVQILGSIWKKMEEYDKAVACYQQAAEGFEQEMGPLDSLTLTCHLGWGDALTLMGRLDEALEHAPVALAGFRTTHGNQHASTQSAMTTTGELYLALGRGAEAKSLFTEAVETGRRERGEAHPATIRAMLNLGNQLRTEGALEDAAPLVLAAAEGVEELSETHELRPKVAAAMKALEDAKREQQTE